MVPTLLAVFVIASPTSATVWDSGPGFCTPEGPAYYALELLTTRNIPGTGAARVTADVSLPDKSPFSVALTSDGNYAYAVNVSIERMKAPRQGHLVAWVTTREIDHIARIGTLDDSLRASGSVSWNKFIVLVTLESSDDPNQEVWTGPIVFRGMSRSGLMHTMVGHGALVQENCAAYGYGD